VLLRKHPRLSTYELAITGGLVPMKFAPTWVVRAHRFKSKSIVEGDMRPINVSLDSETWELAKEKRNFSRWVRLQLRISDDPDSIQTQLNRALKAIKVYIKLQDEQWAKEEASMVNNALEKIVEELE